MAMGFVERLRRAALLSHLQSGHAVREIRCQRQVHSTLRAGTGGIVRSRYPRALASEAGGAEGREDFDGRGISDARGRSRRGKGEDAFALFGGEALAVSTRGPDHPRSINAVNAAT